ncbi:MAG: hypothetical protein IIC36_04995 [Gemmatimonadetes bacterium]|nr:hypothetical protein [Gemmatimonadota bacterium]
MIGQDGFPLRPLLLACLILAGCSDASESRDPIMRTDSAGIEIVFNDLGRLEAQCEIASTPRVTIGQVEGDEPYQLHRVFGATVLSDGRIALVNQGSQELRVYDPEGQFLFAAGGEGDGPGEFRNANSLWSLPGDTVWVGDYRPWEFEVFGPGGEWVRQVRPDPVYPNPPRGRHLLSDGRAILGRRVTNRRTSSFELGFLHVLLHDPDGALTDTLLVLPDGRLGQVDDDPNSLWLYPFFESYGEYAARDDLFISGHGAEPELHVYVFEPDLRLERILRWSGVNRTVRASDVEAARQAIRDQYAEIDGPTRARLIAPLIDEDRPVADALPAFVDVQIGRDGAIWVEEYPEPGGDGPARWIRFEQNGRFSCRTDIPVGIEVYEFGRDYVLGEQRGVLDTEQVVLYELTAPGA